MSPNIRRTFRELFDDELFTTVEIPIIQRDYAQGRASAVEIRTQFLDALYETLSLPPQASDLPRDLDFVYGSLEGQPSAFCPLDGQQRLTTLFLLHWYLACRDGKSDDFQGWIRTGNASRFSYKVRPSSREFFDELVSASVDLSSLMPATPGGHNALSKTIMEYPWFFMYWRQDPTIHSALEMLDAIHERFKESSGFYERIVQIENPYITFQFLDLGKLHLSDELYIKMNARGKALTPFDSFKARIEQHIGKLLPDEKRALNEKRVSLREYFSYRIDSTWPDLFWRHRDPNTHLFDQQFMNYVRAVATVLYPHDREGADKEEINLVLGSLSGFKDDYSFYTYMKNDCLTASFIRGLITLLDGLLGSSDGIENYLGDGAYFDENDYYVRILGGKPRDLAYTGLVQFYAYCAYRIKYPGDKRPSVFYEWVRVASNLANNTIYNRVDEFRESLLAVRKLLDDIGETPVMDYLSDKANPVSGFNRQQIQEERIKAQLMLRNASWRDKILVAEKHRYFKGQIEFLLKFSGVLDRWIELGNCEWSDTDDEAYRKAFSSYYEKAAAIFDENGLKGVDGFLWERALLTAGDFLLPVNKNLSFLESGTRDATWKRLLRGADKPNDAADRKRNMVKQLLDRLDCGSVNASLQGVVDDYLQGAPPPENELWRRMFIDCPEAIAFCKKRQIRPDVSGNTCYLLSKQQMNSIHAELSTFHLHKRFIVPKAEEGKLSPFDVGYETVSNESEQPGAYLHWTAKDVWVWIKSQNANYTIDCHSPNSGLPDRLKDLFIAQLGFAASQEGELSLKVSKDQIEETIYNIVSATKEFMAKEPQ